MRSLAPPTPTPGRALHGPCGPISPAGWPRRLVALSVVAAALVAPGVGDRGARGEAIAQGAQACSLRGSPAVPQGTLVFGAAQGGEAIAKFTGQPFALQLTLAPVSSASASARAALRGGADRGLRVEGFVDPGEVPAFAARNLVVVPDHVFVGGGRRVKIAGAAAGQITAEIAAAAPVSQTLRATGGCDAVTLDRPPFKQQPPSGHARGHVAKQAPLALRAEPGGPPIFSFTSPSVKGALVLWSTERTASAVRVHLTGDVVVDAWVAASDLEPLKEGEVMDALLPGVATTSAPRLSIAGAGAPTPVKAPREAPVRARASEQAPVVGAVEAGAEVLVLETVMGWSSVVPAALHLMPPDGGAFWVKSADLAGPPAR